MRAGPGRHPVGAPGPGVLGRGVRLWDGLGGLHERYAAETVTVRSGATHVFFTR